MKNQSHNKTQGAVGIGSSAVLGGDARFDELMKRLRASGIGKSVSASEWEEIENFIEENILTEDRIQKEYECGYKTGQTNARAEVKKWLLGKSAENFTAGKDDEAKRLRELANTIAA